jgi:nitrite reductase/ring-hydroxylating ferredoxin subunit
MERRRREQVVCRSDELRAGELTTTRFGTRNVVVVVRALDGSLHALASKCLHQGAPLDKGRLYERVADADESGDYRIAPNQHVLKCPWHGYEYDVRTGCAVFDKGRSLRTYEVTEQDSHIVVRQAAPTSGGSGAFDSTRPG